MRLAPFVALGLLAAASPAAARPNPGLWATVNRCDTASAPNSMGVRAAMPGDGSRDHMYVRFRAQFYSHERERWRSVPGDSLSPWLPVGIARYRSQQAGWTFPFGQPPPGTVFRVRAVAYYEWRARRGRGKRRHWVVTMRRRHVTKSGVRGADGGDPAGTSRASCDIT